MVPVRTSEREITLVALLENLPFSRDQVEKLNFFCLIQRVTLDPGHSSSPGYQAPQTNGYGPGRGPSGMVVAPHPVGMVAGITGPCKGHNFPSLLPGEHGTSGTQSSTTEGLVDNTERRKQESWVGSLLPKSPALFSIFLSLLPVLSPHPAGSELSFLPHQALNA